jgi:pyruvate kinase
MVRDAAKRAGREVAIMADLQGPKIRVGKFVDGKGDAGARSSRLCSTPRAPSPGMSTVWGLDYKELPRDVRAGDLLLLNDGLIVLTVQ